jgi:hypothetical protein
MQPGARRSHIATLMLAGGLFLASAALMIASRGPSEAGVALALLASVCLIASLSVDSGVRQRREILRRRDREFYAARRAGASAREALRSTSALDVPTSDDRQ